MKQWMMVVVFTPWCFIPMVWSQPGQSQASMGRLVLFPIERSEIELTRNVKPRTYVEAADRHCAINSYGDCATTRQALTFLRTCQRADGKMMHELSQSGGMIPWFEEYPYGYYHADTTPYYLVAAWDYVQASGDTAFLRESWASLRKAYAYCIEHIN
jgi:hypothetical protein